MNRLAVFLAVALMLTFGQSAFASDQRLTISTNNTPLDRAVLTEVATAAFGQLGYEIEMVSLPSERSLRSANAGEVDGEGLRVAGLAERYPNLVQIPEKFTSIRFVAFASDPEIEIRDWSSLADYRVAFITGWKMFEKHASGAKSVVKVDDAEQMFRMLEAGRIDLVLYTEADGDVFLNTHDMPEISMLPTSLADVDLYLYLHQRLADLADPIAAEVQKMKSDGRYDQVVREIMNSAAG